MTEKSTRQPLLRELHRLLLWVTLPLVLLISVQIYLDFVQASQAAEGFVQRRAGALAYEISQFLAATERGLKLMAKRPGVLLMDPLRCDPGLRDLIALQPAYANVMVIDPRGALICGARMPDSGLPPVDLSDGEGFQAVMAGQSFVLGPVRRDSIVGRWVLSASVPVRGADGSVSGVLAVVIDLTRWPHNAPASDPLADTVQGAIDRTGTILLRSPDAEKWVGRNAGSSQLMADMLRVGEGTFVSKGVQGFDRFWAVQPIAGTPWIAYAGVRADAVRAQPLRQAALSAAVILAILLAALWLALKASRRLTAPIAHLAQVAVRAGAGDLSVRAAPAGPAEIAQVAQEVNRMLELKASAEAELRHQEQSLRITLNSIGDAVIATDAQGQVTRMNPAAEQLTGWPLADALGRPLAEVFRIVSVLTRLPSANPVQRAMDSGEVVGLANHTTLLARDGKEYQIADSAAPIRDAAGVIQGVVLVFSDVSERYRAEAALRVSELALQAISQGVIIAGPDQRITSANASFTDITGYSAAEILGRNCMFLQGPDTDPETVAAIRAAMRRPAEFAGEILNYRKDGTEFWNELTIAPVFDVHGTLAHFIGIMRDVSRRRAAELQLRHQESQLAQADKLAGLGRWEWNLTDDSASWSDELYRIYGRDPADGVPAFDDWQETIHPEDEARLAHCIQSALAGASAYQIEFRIFTKDTGQLRYVESRGSSVVDANGKPTHIRGFDWDITERKLAELALKATNTQLQLLETCVSRLNDIVLITEAEPLSEPGPVIVFVNDAFERRTGFAREEVIGKTPRILQGPKTDRGELDRVRAALERWEPVRAELLNYTKSGEEFWIELDIVPVADATGWYTHWVAVERDVTERKQNLLDMQTSLAEKTALLMEVHHRVKNNLQVITSLLRLESRRSAAPETVDVLKAMQARIHTMAKLHESLYRSGTFASVDLGVYLGQIATQAFQAQVLDDKRVRLNLSMGSVPVGMDQAIECGLLVNELVSNCLKHAFRDDRSGQVYVVLQPADPAMVQTDALWCLRVSDTGVGLPSDFEEKRKTSLGLILAEDLSQQLGGTLSIQSQPGIGAEFSVVFKALEPVPLAMPV